VASRAYCRCKGVGTEVVDGGLVLCSECGNVRPDPLMLAIFREQRKISRQQAAILRRLEGIESARGDSSEDEQPQEMTTAPGSELVGPAELGRRLGMSSQWVRDHHQELGGVRHGDGPRPRYWFDPVLAPERFFAATTNGSKQPEPVKPRRRPRRRRSSSTTELLEIKGKAA
jgi:hypothetical protein